jgi:hypothetical protein
MVLRRGAARSIGRSAFRITPRQAGRCGRSRGSGEGVKRGRVPWRSFVGSSQSWVQATPRVGRAAKPAVVPSQAPATVSIAESSANTFPAAYPLHPADASTCRASFPGACLTVEPGGSAGASAGPGPVPPPIARSGSPRDRGAGIGDGWLPGTLRWHCASLRGCLRIPCTRAVRHFEGGAHTAPSARTKISAPTEKSTVCCWWPVARPALALSACVATSRAAGAAASALQQPGSRFLGPATSGVKTGYGVAGPRNDKPWWSLPGCTASHS